MATASGAPTADNEEGERPIRLGAVQEVHVGQHSQGVHSTQYILLYVQSRNMLYIQHYDRLVDGGGSADGASQEASVLSKKTKGPGPAVFQLLNIMFSDQFLERLTRTSMHFPLPFLLHNRYANASAVRLIRWHAQPF